MMGIQRLFHELGLHSLFASALDTKIIILQRFVRFFAFGGSTIVLALYLHEHDIPASQIGLFMSLTFVGDIISFGLSLIADGIGRKHVLAIGALMMAFSGFAFATSGNFWVLLLAGIVGIISPNGREIGPFTSIEESTLAHLTAPEIRSDIFAWYVVIGSAGSAAGKFTTGWAVQQLQAARGWTSMRSYQAVFFTYAMLGLLNFVLAWFLSPSVELQKAEPRRLQAIESDEEDALLPGTDQVDVEEPEKRRTLIPKISRESRGIIFKLCCLFAVDSLASGLVPASWVTYFFYNKFSLPTGSLGTIFSIMAILSAISSVVAASLSKRIGLVNTMVFTHLPSAIALALIPIPSSLTGAIIFLVIRSSLASMDIAPKAAFLSMVVQPGERTAVMGFVSVVRTFSQSCGPYITGLLAQSGSFWVTFILAGSLKAAYDMGLLIAFSHHKVQDRQTPEGPTDETEA
ncbi:MFS transporter [Mollisia scopiformis]|uniref:MFS transporter n=1 Tax=Mollisia scopiformis TaxID=149040 RepID=A0A194XKV5_MOLSC|nr:MFS transporter [Mollisia scopiformis]KUJ20761.1 MFS transporter [Mollisia scopiformis]